MRLEGYSECDVQAHRPTLRTPAGTTVGLETPVQNLNVEEEIRLVIGGRCLGSWKTYDTKRCACTVSTYCASCCRACPSRKESPKIRFCEDIDVYCPPIL